MINVIGDELHPEITALLVKHHHDWKFLQQKLKSMMIISQSDGQCFTEKGNSLEHIILDSKATCHSESSPLSIEKASDSEFQPQDPEIKELFKQLDLHRHYCKKLSVTDAITIRQQPTTEKVSDSKKLFSLVLHKIISYDVRCRSNLLVPSSSVKIHPMDSLLALIHCADDFLRQDLLTRLATCQLAIPLILPDPSCADQLIFPLWAMRSIVKEWKCLSKDKDGDKVIEREYPIVSYSTPIISFIRFGKAKGGKSKSKLLNEVISDSHHDHFFHRDLSGGHYNQLLAKGLIEVCWYLPAGKPDDIFPDAITFLNLRGDASEHYCQTRLLSQISSMCFALIEEDSNNQNINVLRHFSMAPGGIILLTDATNVANEFEKCIPEVSTSIDLTTGGEDDIRTCIRECIREKLFVMKPLKSLEHCAAIIHYNSIDDVRKIKIDEDSFDLKQGMKLASDLEQLIINSRNLSFNAKERMLPLQGKELWQKWASKDKAEHLRATEGGSKVQDSITLSKTEKTEIRKRQLKYVECLTPVMKSYLITLLTYTGKPRQYFLHCLKLCLDNLSRESVATIQHKYQKTRQQLAQLKLKEELGRVSSDSVNMNSSYSENSEQILKCKKEMEDLHEQLINASFGLEHLQRELGQLYEAALTYLDGSTTRVSSDTYSFLPKVAAELLVSGYPLELMDGDAAHVPIQWVADVIKELVQILNDPKVYILSVLGLQSTGKSTMMNTSFGLRFNVSAGRCTRGAFMQLLPVSEEVRKQPKCKCDFVVVIDTEGLRAPELGALQTQKHDNALATFVIGLATVCLINIYGEVPGDMDDILQTSVHAFLRMKRVRLTPSCQFIHQNAGASSKGEMGRVKFTQKLDEMTLNAAREEKCEEQFSTFNDIIKFDDQNDVHHFPCLWKGDPPMAPVNKGYSESAQNLKLHMIEGIRVAAVGALSNFGEKLCKLWSSLLQEDFIFSFKIL